MKTRAYLALALSVAACNPDDPGYLTASGTVEVVETDVAAMAPARVTLLAVREGDVVQAGDTVARLTQSTLASDIELRQARVAAAQAALRDLEAGARPAELERVRAELRAAEAEVVRTGQEVDRATALLQAQAISQSRLDDAKLAAQLAVGKRDAIRESLSLLQEGSRDERIQAAKAEVAAAQAALAAARATSADLVLTAPVSGTVLARYVETGEVLGAGVPALSLGDLARPWVRVFVAAPHLPKLSVGQEALAELLGETGELFAGRIVSIDAQAQFTPRIALTEEERSDLMFGVKVELAAGGMVRPGLPVYVHFDTTGTGFPASLTDGRTVHPLSASGG